MKNILAVSGLLLLSSCAAKESNEIKRWIGNYTYDEEPVSAMADYSMAMNWNLEINDEPNSVFGLLEVNGQQTSFKLLATLSLSNEKLLVMYDKTLDGVVAPLAKGDTLFVLSMRDNHLITNWKSLEPRLLENAPNECECFKRTKSESH
jgi:hypothetical protein